MDQPVLMHADIHERPEINDIADGPLKDHARLEILYFQNIAAKDRRVELLSGITARLLKLLNDIVQGILADPEIPGKLLLIDGGELLPNLPGPAVPNILFAKADRRKELLRSRIALRMDARHIERVRPAADPQKARTLLKGLGTELRDFQEHAAVPERAIDFAVCNNVLRNRFIDAGNVRQERARSRIHIDAHPVHAVLNDTAEGFGQSCLIHIVLVLAHADRFRIDLDELRQRILQTAGDGCRASLRARSPSRRKRRPH